MKFLDDMFKRDRIAVDILTEAVNYGEMFKDVVAFSDKFGPSTVEQQSKALIASARKVLRKQDRIVWFLRWAKVEMITDVILPQGERKEDATPHAQMLASKVYADMSRKTGIPAANIPNSTGSASMHRLLDQIEHFLSLPIHAITTTVFSKQTPDDLIEAFATAEDEWKKEAEDAFVEDDSRVEALIEFPDGFGWYMLNKAYCSKESQAMGHCGNSPRQYTRDNILSLRKKIVRGDATLMKPYATFILNEERKLTEMKGRFNNKPEAALHPYIVALLKLDIIEGIRGGGYMPQNNFSLYDLDDDVREELVNEKPELEGFSGLYRKHGVTAEVLNMAEDVLSNHGMSPPTFVVVGNKVKLQEWTDLERFANDIDDYLMSAFVEAYENMKNGENLEVTHLDDEDLYDIIKALKTSEYRRLVTALGLEPVSPNSQDFHRSIRSAARELRNSVLFDDLLEAAGLTAKPKADILEKMKARIVEYLEAGYYFEGSIQYIEYDAEDPIDGSITLWASGSAICDMVADYGDGDADDYHDAEGRWNWDRIEQAGSWHTPEDYLSERRKEAGLSDAMGYKSSVETDEEFAALLGDGVDLNIPEVAQAFAKIAGL